MTIVRARVNLSVMLLCLVFGPTGFGAVARAQTFSAELLTKKAGGQPADQPGRVYVSNQKVRIETPELADGFFVVDGERRTVLFARPRQHIFMDAKQSSPLTQVFVTVNANDACRTWQIMEAIAGGMDDLNDWRCDRLGRDIVDGRETIKYQVASRDHGRSYRWIDPQREFPVKLENEDGTAVMLENIEDAPQASILFAIPTDYRRFDPVQLIEQIKQSDVWVAPPGDVR
jgi:hypothetical protein